MEWCNACLRWIQCNMMCRRLLNSLSSLQATATVPSSSVFIRTVFIRNYPQVKWWEEALKFCLLLLLSSSVMLEIIITIPKYILLVLSDIHVHSCMITWALAQTEFVRVIKQEFLRFFLTFFLQTKMFPFLLFLSFLLPLSFNIIIIFLSFSFK